MSWFKALAEYIEGARYELDGFHLLRSILTSACADETKRRALSEAVYNGKWTEMNRLLTAQREEADADSRQCSIQEVHKYLFIQSRGIRAIRKYELLLVGCSAEGHVSHVLSARVSSRPMGWSYLGAYQMAHLRVLREYGVILSRIHFLQSMKRAYASVS